MSKAEKIICAGCFLLILIHLVASFFPRERLWGINQLHYFPLEFRLAMSAVGLLVLVPQVNKIFAEVLTRIFDWITEKFKKINKYFKYSIVSLLGLIVFWFFRAKTPLLGDGYLRAGEIKLGKLMSITEPVDFYLHLLVSRLFGLDGYTTYAVLSCVAGALFVFLILLFCDLWGKDGRKRLFIFLILATTGATQLFFGYIESYSFMYVALTAYIFFSIRYLKGESGFLWPCLFLLLAASLHLSALFVLPSLFYLAFVTPPEPIREKTGRVKFVNMVSLVCVISLMGAGLYLLKTYPSEEPPGSFLIYPFGGGESFYSFFSFAHILDFLNHQLLISPVSLVLWMVLLVLFWWAINFRENAVKFLMWVVGCSFSFALLIDPKLGYARDWDIFAFAGLGVTFLGLYLLVDLFRTPYQTVPGRKEKAMELGRVTVILCVTSLIFTGPWILVNASEKKAIARFEDLLKIDEKRAAYGYETLASYYRDKGEFQKTIEFWENAIAINPIPRYHAALGTAYRMIGRHDLAIEAFERSIQMAPDRPLLELVHRSLGMCLAEAERYDEAVSHLKKAISLRPNQAIYYYTLGKTLGRAGKYEEAVPYFEKTLKLDPKNTEAYKVLGITYARMGKKEEAKKYLETYLELMPKDAPWIRGIIDSIEIETEDGR